MKFVIENSKDIIKKLLNSEDKDIKNLAKEILENF